MVQFVVLQFAAMGAAEEEAASTVEVVVQRQIGWEVQSDHFAPTLTQ